jgi:hypothetical protein
MKIYKSLIKLNLLKLLISKMILYKIKQSKHKILNKFKTLKVVFKPLSRMLILIIMKIMLIIIIILKFKMLILNNKIIKYNNFLKIILHQFKKN